LEELVVCRRSRSLIKKLFLLKTSRVPTGSMEKTILVGDFLFVNKFIYGSSSPRTIPFTDIRLPYFELRHYASLNGAILLCLNIRAIGMN